MKAGKIKELIELSDEESSEELTDNDNTNININNDLSDLSELGSYNESTDIILIQKEKINYDDDKIMHFVKFCLKNNLFDDTFYDYRNAFSIIATKLPKTFGIMSKDGESVDKKTFITVFKKNFKYDDDIRYIYSRMDEGKKGRVTWD